MTHRVCTGQSIALCLAMFASACDRARSALGNESCISWKHDLSGAFAERCTGCHGTERTEGEYRVTQYVDVLGKESDAVPNVIPGDPESRVITVLNEDDIHRTHVDLQPQLVRWIVACGARFVTTELHGPGIMDPRRPDFHATVLERGGDDLARCAVCHGVDFAGGTANASCLTCHPAGPDDCSTCHAGLLDRDAHRVHVDDGNLRKAYDCNVCHTVPEDVRDDGHVVTSNGAVDLPPAEVVFSGPAWWDATAAGREGPPRYEPGDQTCVNVYCHGDALEPDRAATRTEPRWNDAEPFRCGDCHGDPPEDHASPRCHHCHEPAGRRPQEIVDFALHLDGIIQAGSSDTQCAGCHGTGDEGAPAS